MTTTEPRNGGVIYTEPRKVVLDITTMRQRTEEYPPEIAEGACYMADFIHRRCGGRKVSGLITLINKLGYSYTDSTISKILRGYMYCSATGEKLDSPVIHEEHFLEMIRALQVEDLRMEQGSKVAFVETSTWELILKKVSICQPPESVTKFALIYGDTGTQKSESFKEFKRRNPMTCKYMECPEKPNIGQFIGDLAYEFGHPTIKSSMMGRRVIEEAVNDRTTIILDNIQRMHKEKDGWDQVILNYLIRLQEIKRCTFILSLTKNAADRWINAMRGGFLEQLAGRCGGRNEFFHVPTYAPAADVLKIANAFLLIDAEKHLDELVGISRRIGLIRVLFHGLQRAQLKAKERGSDLTIGHIREVVGDGKFEQREAA